jgi:predicted component of type VI protein secretion system
MMREDLNKIHDLLNERVDIKNKIRDLEDLLNLREDLNEIHDLLNECVDIKDKIRDLEDLLNLTERQMTQKVFEDEWLTQYVMKINYTKLLRATLE